MAGERDTRSRIIDAAAELFAEHGYEGTGVRDVAARAGVSPSRVRALTGNRADLFAAVMAEKVSSEAAARIARAAQHPGDAPALAAVMEVAAQVLEAPEESWDVLELEALTRAQRDGALRLIEAERIGARRENILAVMRRLRETGGLDDTVDITALAHLALALSVGMAAIDQVVPKPDGTAWESLIARIATAMAPAHMLLAREHEPRAQWRLRIDVPDRPGGIARLIHALSTLHTYMVSVTAIGSEAGYRTVDVALTAPESVSAATLEAAAGAAGRAVHLTPGSSQDLLDLPTRILDSAAELVANPGWAPAAAARIVEADRMEVVAAAQGEGDRAGVLRLQWTADRHVLLRRDWAPFARAEQTRASALLRLSAAIAAAAGVADAQGWVDPVRSGTVWIRLAVPEDAEAVTQMHRRCSPRTLYRRYVSAGDWHEIQMRRLAGGHSGATLVAIGEEGRVIGLANVFPERAGDERSAEIALLVEDAHQGQGLGTALLRRQLQIAARMGFESVVAVVLAENTGMIRMLERTGLEWRTSIEDGAATMRAALADLVGAATIRSGPDHPGQQGADAPTATGHERKGSAAEDLTPGGSAPVDPRPDEPAAALPEPDEPAAAQPEPDEPAAALPEPDEPAAALPEPDGAAKRRPGGRTKEQGPRGTARPNRGGRPATG